MTEDVSRRKGVILFDGVCNLCNASVQWVIERDPKGRFHFGALQSQAARAALLDADPSVDVDGLPDSVLLVDSDGVHQRSTAALRVARGLGFPYSLLWAAVIVPRPVRDWAYRLIARNRYRWFGRKDSCMVPTPELAERFIDRGEPRAPVGLSDAHGGSGDGAYVGPVAPSHGGMDDGGHRQESWISLGARFAIAYLALYIAPLDGVLTPAAEWVGNELFNLPVSSQPTGSGDRAYDWALVVVNLALAAVISLAWTLGVGIRRLSPVAFDIARTATRLYLAFIMLTYGWVKLFPLQFPAPGPDRFILPYGDSSPMGLAWTFLGASVGYQMFAGLSELVGGYLLFWRRTATAGALVTFAVMTNVLAINVFHDVPVKLFAAHLLLMALFVAAPDLPRIVGLLGFNLPVQPRVDRPFWRDWGRLKIAVVLAHLGWVGFLTYGHVTNGLEASRVRGVLAEPHPLAGVYRVEAFEREGVIDRDNPDADRWVRFGLNPPFTATVQWASGEAERMRLVLDDAAGTLTVFGRGLTVPDVPTFAMDRSEEGMLTLEGVFRGAATTVRLRLQDEPVLLRSRGFRLINEYPFNR